MTPRDTARAWLADPMGVVLDFETTGWTGYAVEVAVVDMTGAEVLSMRLWPGDGVPMDAGALACHGIRLDDVKGLPTWADAWPHLRDALAGRLVVAYNATTERGVLAREALRCGSPLGEREVVCAMQLWRRHLGQPRAVPLPGGDHSALGDARAALEVVRRVAGVPCRELARATLACPFRCLDCDKVVGPTVTSHGERLPTRCGRD